MAFAALLRSPLPLPAAAAGDRRRRTGTASTARAPSVLDRSASGFRSQRRSVVRMSSTGEKEHTHITGTSGDFFGLNRELKITEHPFDKNVGVPDDFKELKQRFLNFKSRNCVGNPENYQKLAERQEPKFLVIACADSRVCPSDVLGFQPGEAFTVRNVANLVPPYEDGPSETKAALEFAVTSLQVPNVLVVGHSRCGGIQALMSIKDDAESEAPRSFIRDWVLTAKGARLTTKATAGNLSFESQCSHCEKESINNSLLNLLTYPWIRGRMNEGKLSLHGGYYNFIDCTFEKWTLSYQEEGAEGSSKFAIANRFKWS